MSIGHQFLNHRLSEILEQASNLKFADSVIKFRDFQSSEYEKSDVSITTPPVWLYIDSLRLARV